MNNQLRLSRLTELKKMLDTHQKLFPDISFNMVSWLQRMSPFRKTCKIGKKEACGTAACALGSAAIHPPFIRQGLRMRVERGDNEGEPYYLGKSGYEAGEKFFGITDEEAQKIFSPEEYCVLGNSISLKDVSERVAGIIKEYKQAA